MKMYDLDICVDEDGDIQISQELCLESTSIYLTTDQAKIVAKWLVEMVGNPGGDEQA